MGVLSPDLVVMTILFQCTLQGVLVPLLVSFLTSQRDQNKWFKAYVVGVNLIALAETIIHIVPLPGVLNGRPPYLLLILGPQIATDVICASVQGFFMFRCWRIFRQRLLPLVPFLMLYLMSIVAGVIALVQIADSLTNVNVLGRLRITFTIWMFSLFLLDLSMTITTIVYLYRACAGYSGRDSVSSTVWQVIWASASPPLLIMAIPIVNQFLAKSPIDPVTVFPVGVSGKFFVLSLMISLVGRGYIREKFDQLARGATGPDDPPNTTFGMGIRNTELSTVLAFSHRASVVYELEAVRQSPGRQSPQTSSSDATRTQLQTKNPVDLSRTETNSAYSEHNKIDV